MHLYLLQKRAREHVEFQIQLLLGICQCLDDRQFVIHHLLVVLDLFVAHLALQSCLLIVQREGLGKHEYIVELYLDLQGNLLEQLRPFDLYMLQLHLFGEIQAFDHLISAVEVALLHEEYLGLEQQALRLEHVAIVLIENGDSHLQRVVQLLEHVFGV